ncbi:hypothetical protein Anas_12832 [Armadillidium nasatum]|uniref:Tumor protein p53-inducible protein 13 n=1 Tax=Armadillidium nasatum TaxID=96803 RepID=A0A5N5T2E9_9CRUS|nr:hypothetical protein Anas_12832 [Armadillidium nasatum]
MIIYKISFILFLSLSPLYAKLVFKPGSDVGYIVPDDAPDNEYENEIEKKYLQESEIKNEVKRAFWDTLFDNISDLEKGENPRATPPFSNIPENLRDEKHGVAMGISDQRCDDAKTNLEVDWDGSPRNHTCYTPKKRLNVRLDLQPLETCDDIPPNYTPKHFCMNYSILYNTSIPTAGSHRPLWPVFGEYRFVPPQRWLHSIEHGSVVMLYHPCAEPLLVHRLKTLVKECVYKHIITPSNMVTIRSGLIKRRKIKIWVVGMCSQPLVLVAWGCKIEMAVVDEERVVDFIRARALKGPEGTLSKQGTFSQELIEKSVPPSGSSINDANLCPNFV